MRVLLPGRTALLAEVEHAAPRLALRAQPPLPVAGAVAGAAWVRAGRGGRFPAACGALAAGAGAFALPGRDVGLGCLLGVQRGRVGLAPVVKRR